MDICRYGHERLYDFTQSYFMDTGNKEDLIERQGMTLLEMGIPGIIEYLDSLLDRIGRPINFIN
ncbi:hypothetical protein [Arenibacter algicola]|uniref:hypothetical protein n=1 Tax=Arenibacter algicola TaxID=616991 RepID=UPI001151A33E|nr:hypothetical protein [Arenibacter algicola]